MYNNLNERSDKMKFEINNFNGINTDTIEILATDSALGLLNKCNNQNIKVCMPLMLSIGKIIKDNPFNRTILFIYDNNEYAIDYPDDFNKLCNYVKKASKIRIWSSHLNCDEYCMLLLICHMFKDKEISVIFSDSLSESATSIGTISQDEYNKLIKKEIVLTNKEKEQYINEWNEIISDNKELRIMHNKKVKSISMSELDTKILERLSKVKKISLSKFITELITNPVYSGITYPKWLYIYLIERYLNKKLIKKTIIDEEVYININM